LAKLSLTDRAVVIQCSKYDIEDIDKAKTIPYAHHNNSNTEFITTIRNIDLVLALFRGIESLEDAVAKGLPKSVTDAYAAEILRRRFTDKLLTEGPQGTSSWLRRHQQLGVELSKIHDRFGFFYDTRTGKTPMGLQIIVDDVVANPSHKWLVLCPLILIENAWLEDAAKFFPDIRIQSLHATTKQKRLALFNKPAQIYVTNIESFIDYASYIEKLPIHGCLVDESSTMKSHSSKFGKAAVEYSHKVKRWYLLSGTPAPNNESEYYRQLQSIDFYGVHKSWTQFKNHFFKNISRNPQYEKLILISEKEEEFIALLRRYSLYIDKEDVLTTPGREFIIHEVHMPEELVKQYTQMRIKLYAEFKDGLLITAPSTAAKINKLNQITSGFIIQNEEATHLLSEYRFKALDDLLKNVIGSEKQVIIWANYKEEFRVLKSIYKDRCGLVYGGVDITEKNANIRAFKEGKIQYLIANPASADKGLTLTNTHNAVYFSMNHSYELFKQSAERIYGDVSIQKDRCNYYILVAPGTIDKAIYDSVISKRDMSMAILNHLKGGI